MARTARRTRIPRFHPPNCRQGKILFLFAAALPLLLTLVAYAIGLTYVQLTRMKLQSVIDTVAAAAADRYATDGDKSAARDVAYRVAAANEVQGEPLALSAAAIQFGRCQRHGGQWRFSRDARNPNAIRVEATVSVDHTIGPASWLNFIDRNLAVDVTRAAIATQVDRDISIVADRSFGMAFDEDELLPVDIGLPLDELIPSNRETLRPRSSPPDWTWCLPVPVPSKWTNLIVATEVFLSELSLTGSDEQVALVTFAELGRIDEGLSLDYLRIINTLQQLGNNFCGGAHNVQSGIEMGVRAVRDPVTARPAAEKILVLVVGSRESQGRPVQAARLAFERGAIVHTVSYGADADAELLQRIAAAGGGNHWHADNLAELMRAFRRIARSPRAVVVRRI